ncbi:hypothetical protein AU255_18210 [Methyloprofundus sedimenti]|uniref:DUF4398 domain-containing protein n=1 Tax=Methyloprofundus sedimenti TaxID=1420851 RepID=A0A1V8M1V2_9GAMM|nr:hypothetical protein [Methyloprofundus sedimenti]OQK15403.1 hypothetical protein AU255_18210 [Methyloprofundus sedimenti]
MRLLKSAAVAATLTLSLGVFSTNATAVCMGMACMYNNMTPLEAINATISQTNQAMKSINDKADNDIVIAEIKDALKISKEINANDKVDRNRMRANGFLKKARTAVKKDDLVEATAQLKNAAAGFENLKGMLNLTQADRASQQTHMLNRILDTHDSAAGSK